MKWGIHRRISPIALVVTALVAWLVHALLHVPFWLALGFILLGVVLNAVVRTAGGKEE